VTLDGVRQGDAPGSQSPLSHLPSLTRSDLLLIGAITLFGAGLRVLRLDTKGLWLDEAFSLWMAALPLDRLFAELGRLDQHPPLYYALLHFWAFLGRGEATARLLSALFSAAAIPVVFLLGRRLLGNSAGFVAALLLALSPFQVRFAQETRMYALFTFNAAAALLALAHLLTGDRRRRVWAAYVAFSVLTLWTHNTAIFFFAAVNLFVIPAILLAGRRAARHGDLDLPPLRAWLWAQAAAVAVWSLWLPTWLDQVRRVDEEFWIQPPTRGVIAELWPTFASAHLPAQPDSLKPGVSLLAAALVALGIATLRARPRLLALLLALCAAPVAGELLVSLRRPIFYDRTLIWVTIPFLLLVAAGVTALRRWPPAQALALLLFAGANVLALNEYYRRFEKEQWREAAAYVAQAAGDGDLLLFNASWVQLPFEYYFARSGRTLEMRGAPADLFDAGVLEPKMTAADVPALEPLLAANPCVWLVYSHNWYTDPESLLPRTLERTHNLYDRQHFYGLELRRYGHRWGSCE
jgi:4-amino-4-deoxy-L-arabinose transferase-like glycosyltransferase